MNQWVKALLLLFLFVGVPPGRTATVTTAVADLDAQQPTIALTGIDFGDMQDSSRVLQAVGPEPIELTTQVWSDELIVAFLAETDPGTYLFAVAPTSGATSFFNVTLGVVGPQGQDGEPGADGVHCWDLDENSSCDLSKEDTNGDGLCSAVDCTGPKGDNGAPGVPWSLDGTTAYYAGGNVVIGRDEPLRDGTLEVDALGKAGHAVAIENFGQEFSGSDSSDAVLYLGSVSGESTNHARGWNNILRSMAR